MLDPIGTKRAIDTEDPIDDKRQRSQDDQAAALGQLPGSTTLTFAPLAPLEQQLAATQSLLLLPEQESCSAASVPCVARAASERHTRLNPGCSAQVHQYKCIKCLWLGDDDVLVAGWLGEKLSQNPSMIEPPLTPPFARNAWRSARSSRGNF